MTSGLLGRTAVHGARLKVEKKGKRDAPHIEDRAEVSGRDQTARAVADLLAQLESATLALRRVLELLSPRTLVELNLTPREMEALGQLALMRSNREIAREFGVSENTVKYHMKNLLKKLGVKNRGQAIMVARALVLDLSRADAVHRS